MKKNAIYLTLLLTAFVLQAQRPITVIPQDNVKLSWGLKNLTVVDGHLYGCSNGVMVGSEMSGGMVYMLRPDTLAHYLGSDFSYVVRNPYDSLLYFSRMDASRNSREGKHCLMLSDGMVKEHGLNAGQLVREAAKLMQGGGGGQPHYASAGGKNPDGLSAAIDKVVELCNL